MLITEVIIPGAQPRWAADAAAEAGIVVLAMPLHRFTDLDPRILDGKLVVDAMNYWAANDGDLEVFAHGGTSEIVPGGGAASVTSARGMPEGGRSGCRGRTGIANSCPLVA